MKKFFLPIILFASFGVIAQKPAELIHTYSIVARDSVTGHLGVAVQSHWFAVGAACPYLEAGVGAVATQSFVNATYGPKGLSMLQSGSSVENVVESLTSTDELKNYRQLGIIDNKGNVAGFTGESCIDEFCQIQGPNYIVQANMMDKKGVCKAMKLAFETTSGSLETRMLEALNAAQNAGGDIRGKQSAAMKIVTATATGDPLKDVYVDLRVDDHRHPLKELNRLLTISKAYRLMNESDEALANNNSERALQLLDEAVAIQPRNVEIQFWKGVAHLNNNNAELAWATFAPIFNRNQNWSTLLTRIKKVGLITANQETWNEIVAKMGATPSPVRSTLAKPKAPLNR